MVSESNSSLRDINASLQNEFASIGEVEYFPLTQNQIRFKKMYNISFEETSRNITFPLKVLSNSPEELCTNVVKYLNDVRIFKTKLKLLNNTPVMAYSKVNYPLITFEKIAIDLSDKEYRYSFDLYHQTPFRCFIDIKKDHVEFLFNIHHLFFDGKSIETLKEIIRNLGVKSTKNTLSKTFDFLDYSLEESRRATLPSPSLDQAFNKFIGKSKPFCFSKKTRKDQSTTAKTYQLKTDKKEMSLKKKHSGLGKMVHVFHRAIFEQFDRNDLIVQIPLSVNGTGKYIYSLGYYINILIYKHQLNQQVSSWDQEEKAIEENLWNARKFINTDLMKFSDDMDPFYYSSILFNYIPIKEDFEFQNEVFGSYDNSFYRELLLFVYESETNIYFKIVFSVDVFNDDTIKNLGKKLIENLKKIDNN